MVRVYFYSFHSQVTRKRADGTDLTERSHDEVHRIYGKKLAIRVFPCDFAERARHPILVKGDDYTEYPMLDNQNRATGYHSSPIESERAQENLILDVIPNFHVQCSTGDRG